MWRPRHAATRVMLFTSSEFLYAFLPLFLAVYYASSRALRPWVITAASYVFYGWWRPDFVLLMALSTVVDFQCGRWIETARRKRPGAGREAVVLSCCVNLGLLAYFKYANFGIDTLNTMLASAERGPVAWADVVLPVGISFYTFQTLSYTVDVFRGDAPPVRRFRDFACYVSMFPQLVAGPIVRYRSIADQLRERVHSRATIAAGVLYFQSGIVKKVLLADTLAGPADAVFAAPGGDLVTAWIGAVAYTFQLYFDFSGYSDMAIGLGLLIGFRLPVNFDRPYASASITEFWRRWHISLSSFLRDYLYVPLGGNRGAAWRTYRNLALTMLLGGLWHGAAWTFVLWGAYQGAWLIAERLRGKRGLFAVAPRPLAILGTFVTVVFGWVLFRAASVDDAVSMSLAMVGLGDAAALGGAASTLSARALLAPSVCLAFGLAAFVVWWQPTTQRRVQSGSSAWAVLLQPLFLWALIALHDADDVPFLYFQF